MTEKRKLCVAVVFGGRSTEHDVSVISALGILKNINRDKYNVQAVRITREGQWEMLSNPDTLDSAETLITREGKMITFGGTKTHGFFRIGSSSAERKGIGIERIPVDVVFPMLHGTFGEDGTVQGLLSMAGLPYVGAGVTASALGMDKVMMKQLFFQNDIPAVDYLWFFRKDWNKLAGPIRKGATDEIGYPCFVKASNSGSSVSVFKAGDENELTRYVNQACQYDRKILVEKAIDARELECAVLGNDEPEASDVGEIIPANEFYDYDAKYLNKSSKVIIPADIPDKIAEQVRHLSVQAFKALDCAGMARVDFLLERRTNRLFVNELNTIPGFTPISMYPKLWDSRGLSYDRLIDRLIELAIERHLDCTQIKIVR